MTWARTLLRGCLLVVFISLFGVSFWESWARLADAARHAKVPHPGPWPWAVDGFILVMVLLVILALLEGRKPHLPRIGVLALTALSATIAVLYTPDDAQGRWHAAYFVSAWPPVGAWLSFEGLMWLAFGTQPVTVEARDPHAVDARTDARDLVAAGTQPRTRQPRALTASEQRKVDVRHARGESGRRIARETGIPEQPVLAYLRALRPPPPTPEQRNGDHSVEVPA